MPGEPHEDKDLDRLLYVDEVTGLRNRRALHSSMRSRIDWSNPQAGASLALLHIERPTGMSETTFAVVLVAAAVNLRELVQPGVGLARHSSTIFALLFPDRSRADALVEARRYADATASRLKPDVVAITVGVAGRPDDGNGPPALLEEAARALRAARRSGPGTQSLPPPRDVDADTLARLPSRITVGRDESLARADSFVRALDKPTLVVVRGPGGFGKSRFLDEVVKRARDAGHAAIRADGEEVGSHSPYRVIGLAIERLGRDIPDLELHAEDKMPPERILALQGISMNFFTETNADAGVELPSPAAATAAVVDLLRLATRVRPAMLFAVGNAAHADNGTLEVMKGILASSLPVAIVMGVGEVPEGCSLAGFLASAAPHEEIEMRPLLPQESEQLMLGLLPPGASSAATAVSGVAAGCPLYAEEVSRAAALAGRVPSSDITELPPTLKHAMLASLDALPRRVREALNAAAVMGTVFDLDILQELLGLSDLEILEALDGAHHARLIRAADPLVPEVIEFRSPLMRNACYEAIDPAFRKRLHQRLGLLCEVRLPDDAGWLVEAAIFHLDRGGATDRLELLRTLRDRRALSAQGPVGARIQRLEPGTVPLNAPAQAALDALARALVGALRIGRLYPSGSQLTSGFSVQLKQAIDALLAQVSPVTLSVEGAQLKGNGEVLAVRPHSSRQDLRDVMDDRLVSSLTFVQGIAPEEIQALVKGLSEPTPPSAMALDHWDTFLAAHAIKHADILQRAYVARQADARLQARERVFDPAGIRLLHDALRYFKAGVDSLKLYPPGHALVNESFRHAEPAFERLLGEYPSVTLAAAEGRLLANGKPMEARALAETGEFIHDQIVRRKLGSITLAQGLTIDEMQTLARFLTLAIDDAEEHLKGERLLAESDIRHFRFGARIYARRVSVREEDAQVNDATAAVTLPTADSSGRPPKRVSVTPGSRADIRARRLLAAPPAEMLIDAIERQFPLLLEALNFGSMADLAVQLVQHLSLAMRDASADNRAFALRILARALQRTAPETQRMVVGVIAPTLREIIRHEAEVAAVRAFVEALSQWCPAAAAAGAFGLLAEVLRDGVMARRTHPSTPPAISAILNDVGRSAAYKRLMPAFLERLRKGTPEEREQASSLLAALGDSVTPLVVDALVSERSAAVRQTLAATLRQIGPAGSIALARQVQSDTPRDRAVGVLEVLEQAGTSGLDEAFFNAQHHPDDAVRQAASAFVRRAPKGVALVTLRRAMRDLPPEARLPSVRLATELKLTDLAAEVSRLLEQTESHGAIVTCCHYFAAAPSRAAAPLLLKIAESKPKLFGVVKGFPDDVRAAAVFALGQTPGEEVKKGLERVSKESNTTIRLAVNQAMKAKAGERPGSPTTTRRAIPSMTTPPPAPAPPPPPEPVPAPAEAPPPAEPPPPAAEPAPVPAETPAAPTEVPPAPPSDAPPQ